MSGFTEPEIAWSQDQMIEVTLNEPDDFLKVRETLTRIGVASRKEKRFINRAIFCTSKVDIILFISKNCSHWMESPLIFLSMMCKRRNRIITLLSDWGLITILRPEQIVDVAPLNQIKVLSYKDKGDWTLETKYNIGKKKKVVQSSQSTFVKAD